MNQQEVRDELIKRAIEHKQEGSRRELSSEEKREVEKDIIRDIMPRVYKDKK